MNNRIRVFTDGSAIGNPGPGGWGAVILRGKQQSRFSGAVSWTTISEMELLAAVHALRLVPSGAQIELYSDSEWLIHGMRYLTRHWQRHNWKSRRGSLVPHREHWRELMRLDRSLHVRWEWVKGHSGHPMQVEADRLAYQAARTRWSELRLAA